jgi:4'-phosphopantetheinyl transferase
MTALPLVSSAVLHPSAVSGSDGMVRVWSLRLSSIAPAPNDWATLDERERDRADRFRSQADRDRYVVRHAFYRRVLAGYVGAEPQRVGIRVSAGGKPSLVDTPGIDFSTSHTTGMAVIALAHARLGVDIERARELTDVLELASAHLTDRERRLILSVDPGSRSSTFLAIWTAKEAAVKALGVGLSMPLAGFDTGILGEGDGKCQVDGTTLVLSPLMLDDGHVGTVAVEGARIEVRHVMTPEETA